MHIFANIIYLLRLLLSIGFDIQIAGNLSKSYSLAFRIFISLSSSPSNLIFGSFGNYLYFLRVFALRSFRNIKLFGICIFIIYGKVFRSRSILLIFKGFGIHSRRNLKKLAASRRSP